MKSIVHIFFEYNLKWGFADDSFFMPEKCLRDINDIAHKHQYYVNTGAYVKRVLASSVADKQIIK